MVANVVKLKLNGCDSANTPHVFKFGRAKFRNLFPSPRRFAWQQTKLCRNRKSIVKGRDKGSGELFLYHCSLCACNSQREYRRSLIPFPYNKAKNNFKRLLLRKQAKIQNSKFDRIKFGVFAVRVRAI